MNKQQIEEMKKRVDDRTIKSILRICKLHGVNYDKIEKPGRLFLIEIYSQGMIDVMKEVRS